MPVEIKELKVTIEVKSKNMDAKEIEELVKHILDKEKEKIENGISYKTEKRERIRNAR